ncbi:MAG: NAD(P)-dependent oxidoreductase [Candidatus Actinomarinales bacterium]|nr:MAG: NAD(P)-dependent oxidoreductase [Candidatus Actinomarinales bacterium]
MSLLKNFIIEVESRGKNVRVALVGAGQMGQGIVTQLNKMTGVDLVLIVDKNDEKLDSAQAKYTKDKNHDMSIEKSIEAIDNIELDIVIEATGTPSSGADVANKVLNRGINLILLNVETEATIGLALNQEAKRNNSIVTVGDGDEPVAAVELYNFANEIGMEVIAIGKGKNNPFNTFATPKLLKDEAIKKKMNPYMLTSFVDGSKTMIEMAALANYLDFNIDTEGMHGAEATYENLNSIYIPKKDGGILNSRNIVDFAFGIAPGVFAVVYSDDEYVNYEMEYLKMGKGPYWTLARPYHLTSLEIPRTIMSLIVNKETKLSAEHWNVEVVAHAKEDILPGTNLGSIGGNLIYGKAMETSRAINMLPLGIAENNIANNKIKKGDPLTIDDATLVDNQLYRYWKKQIDLINIS